ncbi:hypothetical protein LOZ39_002972 [Ophidiomyces ophidiicola]|nr:hypothetical protein LOZ61_001783 [Ophidiomyces ophidiicola]KAI2005582.1 hypothetical protein LOZ49_005355 [Ophidiomyces ophidiicola]KAI2076075.1 hypothetical protein LOZ39_002972 [Ophidiomyces ophidiicola]KAI2145833.1 hypothetical protein LOZ29_000259 [Ophidiomyces ophidiicola]KAI2146677.1 hypothetical protein LOZ28_000595 [Ophidiomyces ophidiicola]
MISPASSFVNSSFAVGHNAVKSILFRVAGMAVQIGVFKLFSLLASMRSAFTAYLMFTEDYIQRLIFMFSRGFSHQAALVLFLTIFLLGAGLYDTLLWGLDSPGYISQKKNVTATSVQRQMLKRPGYMVFSSTKPGEVDGLNQHFLELMNGNLFNSNLNFTLTGQVDLGTPEPVPATRKFDPANGVGPRIWLDDEGFSVSPDTYATFAVVNEGGTSKSQDCPWKKGENETAVWECSFPNTFAFTFMQDSLIGRPEIHWDDTSDRMFLSEYLRPHREDNPWAVLGVGGDTAFMKQMFTVTKGRRKHTFLGGAMKISSVYDYNAPFARADVQDIVKRSWSTDPAQLNDPFIVQIAEKIQNARAENSSFQLGAASKVGNSVTQVNFEYLNPEGTPGNVVFSLFRISVVNITLIRSETLPEPVKPFEQCNKYYHNEATGGKVYGTNCYQQSTSNKTAPRFFGELDTSAFLVGSGTLGDGTSNISSKAFNQKSFEWFVNNENWLDNLLLSRGYMMAINPDLVKLEISKVQPAMSYLQVTLVVLPVLLAVVVWLLLWFFAASHYSNSLLANLYATTNVGDTNTSADPQYIRKMPDIDLMRKDGRVMMATSTGVFSHGGSSIGGETDASSTNQKPDDPKTTYPPNNNSYYYESPALLPG